MGLVALLRRITSDAPSAQPMIDTVAKPIRGGSSFSVSVDPTSIIGAPITGPSPALCASEHVAVFVPWLEARSPDGIWLSDDLVTLAECDFRDEAGIAIGRARTFLTALKRDARMWVRPNCRVYSANGTCARKGTLYSLRPPPGRISVRELSDTLLG